MKKIILYLFISIILASCSVTQEITIRKNGTVQCDAFIDMHTLFYLQSGNFDTDITKVEEKLFDKSGIKRSMSRYDTIFPVSSLIDKSKIKTSRQQKVMELIKNATFKINYDRFFPSLRYKISGEFKSMEHLNQVFAALPELYAMMKDSETLEKINDTDYFNKYFKYEWNGSCLQVNSVKFPVVNNEVRRESNLISRMLLEGRSQYRVRYRLPVKIKSVNSPDFSYGSDASRHSIEMTYPMINFMLHPEIADIGINIDPDVQIFFDKNSIEIKEKEKDKIYDIVRKLKENPGLNILVIGSADLSTGSRAFNEKIAEERAMNVISTIRNEIKLQLGRVTVGNQFDPPLNNTDLQNRVVAIYFYKNKR